MTRVPPDRLAFALDDVADEADRVLADARRLVRDAERLRRFSVEGAGELHRLDQRVRLAASTRARDRAADAVLAAERVYPIAVEVLEGYPHPGLVRIGLRLLWLGLWSWVRRYVSVTGPR